MIRQNKNIKGYTLFNIEFKINQFADDTSLFLDGSQQSFEYCIQTILEYAKYSGLAMNFDKTKVVWFGCEHPPETVYLPHFKFDWNPTSFTLLGIEFTKDLKNITDININKKLTEIIKDINEWSRRDLTPFGKITVIKTLLVSKIVHILIGLPSPSKKLLNEINNIFYTFLWNKKPDKIKRDVATLKLSHGGLNMINIFNFDKALKLTWIRRLNNTSAKWKDLTLAQFPKLVNVVKYSDKYIQNIQQNNNNSFWENVFKYLEEFIRDFKFDSKSDVMNSSFLFNSQIKIDKKVINDRILVENNVHLIHQLMIENRCLTYREFNLKYNNIKINFLRYNAIISSFKRYIKQFKDNDSKTRTMQQPTFATIMNNKKGASYIYNKIVKNHINPTGLKKWKDKLNLVQENWSQIFKKLIKTTSDTKLRWLQFRIAHSILTTNRSVSKYDNNQSHLCQFCHAHSETIQHLFWECSKVKNFWKELEHTFNRRCTHAHNFKFEKNFVLFGLNGNIVTDKTCDFITLMAKFYIYRSKVQDRQPLFQIFIKELFDRYCVEKYMRKNSVDFRNFWGPYMNIFRSLHAV